MALFVTVFILLTGHLAQADGACQTMERLGPHIASAANGDFSMTLDETSKGPTHLMTGVRLKRHIAMPAKADFPMTLETSQGPIHLLRSLRAGRNFVYEFAFGSDSETHVLKILSPNLENPDEREEVRAGNLRMEVSHLKGRILFYPETIIIKKGIKGLGPVKGYVSVRGERDLNAMIESIAVDQKSDRQSRAILLAHQVMMDILNEIYEFASKDLIHGDIKPGNIGSRDGRVGLFDFDNVNRIGGKSLTVTPRFASPEEAAFESLDPYSDIYSLGRTLIYTLLYCQGQRLREQKGGIPGTNLFINYPRPVVEEFFDQQFSRLRMQSLPELQTYNDLLDLKAFISASTVLSRPARVQALNNLLKNSHFREPVGRIIQLSPQTPVRRIGNG